MSTWDLSKTRHHVLICNGGSCTRRHADEVTVAIRDEIAACGAEDHIHTTRTQCNGRCEDACVVTVYPQGVWYKGMTPDTGRLMVREHLLLGRVLEEHLVYSYDEFFIPTGQGPRGTTREEAASKRKKYS